MRKRGERGGDRIRGDGKWVAKLIPRGSMSSEISIFFSKGDAPALQYFFLIPSSISLLPVLRYTSTIINPFALHIRIVRLELFLEYLSFVFIISFFFSTNMVKATRIAGPLFDLSHFSWRRSRSEMVKIIHERVYCYSSSRILERGLKIDSTFNVSKVHPSPFIQTRPSSKLVFDAMLNSDLFSLSLSPRPAHVPPTEIMKSETQGT